MVEIKSKGSPKYPHTLRWLSTMDNHWGPMACEQFAALAAHLNCDPAELEQVDLVALVTALAEARTWMLAPDHELNAEGFDAAYRQVRAALATLPEKK